MSNIELIKEHEESTMFCSFQHHMRSSSKTYQQIIDKGEEIVPDVLRYLRDENAGMSVMLLLWDILKISPYDPKPYGDTGFVGYVVTDARQAWLDWGEKHNLLP